jgi:hypothetical protein
MNLDLQFTLETLRCIGIRKSIIGGLTHEARSNKVYGKKCVSVSENRASETFRKITPFFNFWNENEKIL